MTKRKMLAVAFMILIALFSFSLLACSKGGGDSVGNAAGTYYAVDGDSLDPDDWIKLNSNGTWEDGTDNGTFRLKGGTVTFYAEDGIELFDGTLSGGKLVLEFGEYKKSNGTPGGNGGNGNTYTATFDSREGSAVSPVTNVSSGSTITPPNHPIKKGYTFDGWYKDTAGQSKWDFYNDTVTKNTTLYAKWVPNNYTITYCDIDDDDFSGTLLESDPTEHTYGTETTLATPTKTGHRFDGWYLKSDGTDSALTALAPDAYTDDITLYAKWVLKQYQVTLERVGGTGGSDSISVTYGAAMPTAEKPAKTGYVFGGYFTAEDGEGRQYYNAEMQGVNHWTTDIEPAVLYANWEAGENLLLFDGNGKTGGNMNAVTVQTEEIVTLPDSTYDKTGYRFVAWNTEADGQGDRYMAGSNYTVPAKTESVVLYAEWTLRIYNIAYENILDEENPNREVVSYTYVDDYVFVNPTRTGYDGEWDIPEIISGSVGDITVTAIWTARSYIVTLNPQSGTGGTASVNATFHAGMPVATAPSRPNYRFLGYFLLEDGQGMQYYSASMTSLHVWDIADNTTLYASWTAVYPIRFEGNGHTGGTTNDIYAALEENAVLPGSSFLKYGYNFLGWSEDDSDTVPTYLAGDRYTLLSDLGATLYAIWAPKNVRVAYDPMGGSVDDVNAVSDSYTITFHLNGGTGTAPSPQTVTTAKGLTYPRSIGSAIQGSTTFYRSGYVFTGWYESSTASGSPFNFANPVTSSRMLYAGWRQYSSSVGGSRDYTGDLSANTIRGLPYYNGTHVFAYYSLAGGFIEIGPYITYWGVSVSIILYSESGSQIVSSSSILNYYAAANTLYYVKVTVSQSSSQMVEISLSGGVPTAGGYVTSSVRYLDTQYGAEYGTARAVRTGHVLLGWYTEKNGLGQKVESDTVLSEESAHTLYADWRLSEYAVEYDANGGMGSGMASTSHTYSQSSSLSTNTYTRDYHTFVGWNTMPDGSGTSYTDAQSGILNLTAEDGVTVVLYAKWKVNTYLVTTSRSIAVAGEVSGSGTYEYDSDVILTATTLNSVYTWRGWYDGIVKVSQGDEMTYSFKMPPENKNFEARWGALYFDENGTEQYATQDVTILTTAENQTLSGWYALSGTVTGSFALTVSGTAHIILLDGCDWTVNGIHVTEGNVLYIYAQSAGAVAGKLSTAGNIGGSNISGAVRSAGEINLCGGVISADRIGGANGANGTNGGMGNISSPAGRIGTAGYEGGDGGMVTIYDGIITATHIGGGNGGNGGNGGEPYDSRYSGGGGGKGGAGAGGTVIVSGGIVTVTTIGGGNGGNGGNGTKSGSGGYGGNGASGTVTVTGGTITATHIGGGNGGNGGYGNTSGTGGKGGDGASTTITVTGGSVTVTHMGGGNGGNGAVGGGGPTSSKQYGGSGGVGGNGGSGGDISVNGGTVSVEVIGGGNGGNGGNGDSYYCEWGGKGGDGGIGGGGGTIEVSGGTLQAIIIGQGGKAGNGGNGGNGKNNAPSYGANGGKGGKGGDGGHITVSDGMVVGQLGESGAGGTGGTAGTGATENGSAGTTGTAGAAPIVDITGGTVNP